MLYASGVEGERRRTFVFEVETVGYLADQALRFQLLGKGRERCGAILHNCGLAVCVADAYDAFDRESLGGSGILDHAQGHVLDGHTCDLVPCRCSRSQ